MNSNAKIKIASYCILAMTVSAVLSIMLGYRGIALITAVGIAVIGLSTISRITR